MKGFVLLVCALAAGIALSVSVAGAAPSGAVAQSAAVGAHTIRLSAVSGAKPRGLVGVPATGTYGFLLKLTAKPTARAYASSLPHGLRTARAAATDQLATVRAAEHSVIAALPTDSRVLYQTHAVTARVAVSTNAAHRPALARHSR